MTVRVRFAPSPTGHLHVGGARTAIFNWLFARHHGGRFIVRVEDTDVARSTRESEQMVLDDLRWLGLPWDEGPDVGGPNAPYRQSERMALYSKVAEDLVAKRAAYRCFCREDELEQKRKAAEAAGRPPHYDLTCYRLDEAEIGKRLAAGAPFVVRFHVTDEGDVTIQDLIRGEVSWKKESLGDFILLRSDGMPTYNFSVVVDDHGMEITHVIRAEEHLTNTHRQVLIYRAMSWSVPEFAHVSLILGQDRTKLSKRHGATSVSAYAEEGYLPDAMFNFLALLGWSPPDGREIFSRDEAIAQFSLDRVNPAPAVFDPQKFAWMNGQYLHQLGAPALQRLLADRFRAAGWLREESEDVARWFEDLSELVSKGAHTLADFVPALRFFFEFHPDALFEDADARAILAESTAVLRALADDLIRNGAPHDSDSYHALAKRLQEATGVKGKKLFQPIRLAVTGMMHGPELHRAIPLLQRGSELTGIAPVLAPLARVEAVLARA